MKMWKIILQLTLLCLMVFASSCARAPERAVSTPSRVIPLIPTSSSTPRLIPTDTPTPSPTLMALPTLPVQEAGKRLLELLSSNSNCHLPCFWGITPGKSTYQQAQEVLLPLSSISQLTAFTPQSGVVLPVYAEGDLALNTNAGFLSENQIVSHIAFQAEEMKRFAFSNGETGFVNIFDSTTFGDRLKFYSLQNVLAEQGIPASVMTSAHGVPVPRGGSGGFDILLLYPDKGILINYTTQGNLVGSNMRGCPVNAHVEMELYPPGQSDSFFESLKKTDWAVKMNYYKPLEEVTSMSLEEFYNTFREPTDKCIETPAKLWPTPEP